MQDTLPMTDRAAIGLHARPDGDDTFRVRGVFHCVCTGADGAVRWEESIGNLVMTAGKVDMLAKYFAGSAYTASWNIGLKGSGTAAAADTMASHAAWSEYTAYSQSTRPAFGTPSASANGANGQVTAAASVFTVNGAGGTVAGMFLCSNNTIGGTTGTLFAATDFTAARTVAAGDTLSVTYTLTLS